MLPPLADDPRLDLAVELFNLREYEEAADLAEELYFEASSDERSLTRVLLQLFVGMVHVQHRQVKPAVERLRVGIEETSLVRDWMGIDGAALRSSMMEVVRQLERGEDAASFAIARGGWRIG